MLISRTKLWQSQKSGPPSWTTHRVCVPSLICCSAKAERRTPPEARCGTPATRPVSSSLGGSEARRDDGRRFFFPSSSHHNRCKIAGNNTKCMVLWPYVFPFGSGLLAAPPAEGRTVPSVDRVGRTSNGWSFREEKKSALCLTARRRGTDRLTFYDPVARGRLPYVLLPGSMGRVFGMYT